MTVEIDRINVLEGKIAGVVEYVHKLSAENEKLRQIVKDLKAERKEAEDLGRKIQKLDEDVKRYENEREAVKGKIEAIISQIDKLGV
jgi:septal ring factor EnvC (AmiA/AmiB activator)